VTTLQTALAALPASAATD